MKPVVYTNKIPYFTNILKLEVNCLSKNGCWSKQKCNLKAKFDHDHDDEDVSKYTDLLERIVQLKNDSFFFKK